MLRRSRPVNLTDAPEHRSIPLGQIEFRKVEEENHEVVLEGYASTFEEYEMYGGPAQYGWIERIDPGAFDKTLREKPDLHLLINHAGTSLARTKSGTLDLEVDDHGLKVVARLDTRDPEAMGLAVKMERGDMDEMSFAFRVKAQEWRAAPGYEEIDDQSYRTITEVSLHKGDVSVVNWGANPTTSAEILSAPDILRALVDADLNEVRAEEDLVKLAKAKLDEVVPAKPTVTIEKNGVRGEELEMEEGVTEVTTEYLSIPVDYTADQFLEALAGVDGLIDAIRDLLVSSTEERDEEEVEDDVTDDVEETDEERISLADALAFRGIVPEEGSLSLEAALALA